MNWPVSLVWAWKDKHSLLKQAGELPAADVEGQKVNRIPLSHLTLIIETFKQGIKTENVFIWT